MTAINDKAAAIAWRISRAMEKKGRLVPRAITDAALRYERTLPGWDGTW